MGPKQNTWITVAFVGCALALLACGSSEDNGAMQSPVQAGGGGAAGVGGSAGAGGSTVTPLPSDTAGKACASDTECAPGTCAAMLEGLDGAATPAPGGYCMGSCTVDADCGAGGACVITLGSQAGECYDSCAADTDCRQGYLCGPITSTCRPAPLTDQLADNTAGMACAADAECGDGTCLTTLRNGDPFPAGYCSGACLMDSHCGAGGVCLRNGAAAGRCYDACAADPECTREGYRCRDLSAELKGCLPAADPLPDNTTGLGCASDADCGGLAGACVVEVPAKAGGMIAAPGGYCTAGCEIDADCGAGGKCIVTRAGALCFDLCAAATECREGYVCGERGGDMPSIVCTPLEPIEPMGDGGMIEPEPDAATP